MPRFIAFLRAINVGGRTVKMERLRQLFESLGYSKVETFIASGNVIFESATQDATALEANIEAQLQQTFGFAVATFLRTDGELADIAQFQPFQASELNSAVALNIAFLANPLNPAAEQALMTLRTDIDHFRVHQREIYWLCCQRQSESTFSNALLEKTVGQAATLRSVNTIKKLAAKYPAATL